MRVINFINRCQGIGESYGFASAQSNIEAALQAAGFILGKNSKVNFAHIAPHMFHREEGKLNVLWFPFEGLKLPQNMVDSVNKNVDLLIASCESNVSTFKNSGVTIPIELCHLGIDWDLFEEDKKKRKEVFRFLWVGQVDIRKGWDLIAPAFIRAFKEDESIQLYMKTTNASNQGIYDANDGKVLIDTRNLALADLVDLYQSAHAFVFPSRGEGTGLPALEALACGAVVLAPDVMGLADFINEDTACPLPYDLINVHYGTAMQAPNVSVPSLTSAMRIVFNEYNTYKRKADAARYVVRETHSIESMAERLDAILGDLV